MGEEPLKNAPIPSMTIGKKHAYGFHMVISHFSSMAEAGSLLYETYILIWKQHSFSHLKQQWELGNAAFLSYCGPPAESERVAVYL